MLVTLKPILQLYSFSGEVHVIGVGGFHETMNFLYKIDDFIEVSVQIRTDIFDFPHKWMNVVSEELKSLSFFFIELHDFLEN